MKQLLTISRYSQVLPRLVAVAAMLALLLATQIGSVPTAHASGSGCTQLGSVPGDAVCIYVQGSGLQVDLAQASFNTTFGTCNTKLYITFFDTSNHAYDQRISSLNSGCTIYRSYVQNYNTTMREGRACGAVSINGVLQPGACVRIFR